MATSHGEGAAAEAHPSVRALARRRAGLLAVGLLSAAASCAALAAAHIRRNVAEPEVLYGAGGASLHAGGISANVGGLKRLGGEVDTALGENSNLHKELTSTFKHALCGEQSLAGACAPSVIDNYLKIVNEATAGDPNEGCCGEENEGTQAGGAAPAPGDMSIGAVVHALEKKFRNMKQQFREVRAEYYKGAPRELTIKVRPRGPRGFTGPPGTPGGQGDKGETGREGEVGPRGLQGWPGDRGPIGRKGAKGMSGSIGEAGEMGPTGFQGEQGNTGFVGPPGSRGLPGAAGVMGSNGKDGPPGPPGRNGVPGPPGYAGDAGNPGAPGSPGKAGPKGPPGSKGLTGTSGKLGPVGPDGVPGIDGVGPAKPGPVKKAGKGTWGPEFLKTQTCTKLGIKENLGGECQPLCQNCDSLSGFMLVNDDGLRYKDMGFDDKNIDAGSRQAKNLCMLARYGSGGDMSVTPTDQSYMTLTDQKVVKEQVHWYGSCKTGNTQEAKCCTNAQIMTKGFDFSSFATGNQCAGDADAAQPTKVLFCVFDEAAFIRQSRPAGPPEYPSNELLSSKNLRSNGKIFEMNLLSNNGIFQASMQRDGNFVLYRQGGISTWSSGTSGKGTGPFRLEMQTDGNLVIYDKDGKYTWNTVTFGKGAVKLVLQDDGNLVLYNALSKAVWNTGTSGKVIASDIKMNWNQAVCVGTACMNGEMFARIKSVSDGMILSGTGEAKLQCSGGPGSPIVQVNFKTAFAKPPAVFVNLNGMHNCQNGGASFRANIEVVEVTTTFVKIKANTWADTRIYSFWFSWMAIGPELTADVANLIARRTESGDDKRGMLCVGRYCAGETMLDRLMSMANSNVQVGRYFRSPNRCQVGFRSEDTITFSRAFTEVPTVLTTIFHYDLCNFNNGVYMRAMSWVENANPNNFKAVATTWADTSMYAIGVQWIAISKNLMVRPRQYFPLVPVPQDSVASNMCFGTMCVDAKKWKDIMNMANWRVETQDKEYYWHCNHRSATMSFTFSEAYEEVPDVQLYVHKIDECGFKDFKWTLAVNKVTTAGFEVELYGFNMFSVQFHWVALAKDLTQSQG